MKIDRCLAVTDGEYVAALRALAEYREAAAALLDSVDLLLTPTLPCVAPAVGTGDLVLRDRLTLFTFPFNMVGAPAVAIPCGPAVISSRFGTMAASRWTTRWATPGLPVRVSSTESRSSVGATTRKCSIFGTVVPMR